MAYKVGNKLYQLRKKDGRDPEYSPDSFAEEIQKYFDWSVKNPFKEQVVVKGTFIDYKKKRMKQEDGSFKMEEVKVIDNHKIILVDKMRPFTKTGLCIFLGISVTTFGNYRKLDEYLEICILAEEVINDQQFQGAASNFLNASIIARKQGLVDRKDVTTDGDKINKTDKERDDRIEELIAKYQKEE